MKNSLRTIILALILSIGVSYSYAAWSPPSTTPTGGNTDAPVNVGSATQVKAGALTVNGLLTAVSNLVVNGNVGIGDSSPDGSLKLDVEGQVGATEYCDQNGANCILATAIGGGGGVEADPTVLNSVKDGVTYAEIGGTGFADGVDDVGADRAWITVTTCSGSCPAGWTSYQSVSVSLPGACNAGISPIATSCYKSF